jgi:hypothetical protein
MALPALKGGVFAPAVNKPDFRIPSLLLLSIIHFKLRYNKKTKKNEKRMREGIKHGAESLPTTVPPYTGNLITT